MQVQAIRTSPHCDFWLDLHAVGVFMGISPIHAMVCVRVARSAPTHLQAATHQLDVSCTPCRIRPRPRHKHCTTLYRGGAAFPLPSWLFAGTNTCSEQARLWGWSTRAGNNNPCIAGCRKWPNGKGQFDHTYSHCGGRETAQRARGSPEKGTCNASHCIGFTLQSVLSTGWDHRTHRRGWHTLTTILHP